jgi:hypothetical protein
VLVAEGAMVVELGQNVTGIEWWSCFVAGKGGGRKKAEAILPEN